MNDMIHSSNCIPHFIKRLGSPVVIALRSRPEDWWFKPWVLQISFSFLFIISSHLGEFSSFQSKKELKNCSFNFIISMFLCMYLSYMIRNRSQKFWDIYQGYLLTFEQGAPDKKLVKRHLCGMAGSCSLAHHSLTYMYVCSIELRNGGWFGWCIFLLTPFSLFRCCYISFM